MKRTHNTWTWMSSLALLLPASTLASDAETSASAGSNTAMATAHYQGDIGFARTNTRTGRINVARGVAVGVDENGLSLSLSSAIAPRRGPALATNFNMSIGRDGQTSTSVGRAVASGSRDRTVAVSGNTTTRHNGSVMSMASGRTGRGGTVQAHTESRSTRVLRAPTRPPHVVERKLRPPPPRKLWKPAKRIVRR